MKASSIDERRPLLMKAYLELYGCVQGVGVGRGPPGGTQGGVRHAFGGSVRRASGAYPGGAWRMRSIELAGDPGWAGPARGDARALTFARRSWWRRKVKRPRRPCALPEFPLGAARGAEGHGHDAEALSARGDAAYGLGFCVAQRVPRASEGSFHPGSLLMPAAVYG